MKLDRRGAELLFQVLTEREEKPSVAVAQHHKTGTDSYRLAPDPRHPAGLPPLTVMPQTCLDTTDPALGCWLSAYRNGWGPLPASMPDDERQRELERRNRELEMELA